jgi:hypothetical protein
MEISKWAECIINLGDGVILESHPTSILAMVTKTKLSVRFDDITYLWYNKRYEQENGDNGVNQKYNLETYFFMWLEILFYGVLAS